MSVDNIEDTRLPAGLISTGAPVRHRAANVFRVCVNQDGFLRLLADFDEEAGNIICPVTDQRRQMLLALTVRESHVACKAGPRRRGVAHDMSMMMVFESVERSFPSDKLRFDSLSTAVLAKRLRLILAVGDAKWVDYDRSGSWSMFRPWTDMRCKELELSLGERDFVRRMVAERFHKFPKGFSACPLCGANLSVEVRHIIMLCPKALRLRSLFLATLAGSVVPPAMFGAAWWWQLRPVRSKVTSAAAFSRRLLAIRLAFALQASWRSAIFRYFGTSGVDEELEVSKRWNDDDEIEKVFMMTVIDSVWANFPALRKDQL